MRVLLYGMQSSGASVLAYTMAQRPDSLAFVDVWNTFAAPVLEDSGRDIVAKVVVTTAYELEAHRRRFRPDVTLLVLRHPVDTFDSLANKTYADENGLIDEKFALLEKVFRSGAGFDHIVYYEDFAFSPADILALFGSIGWELDHDALSLRRTQAELVETNLSVYPDLASRVRYGAGNIKPGSILRDRVRFRRPWGKTAHLPQLCPGIFERYEVVRAERGAAWQTPSRAILSCGLHAVLRELAAQGALPQESERLGYTLDFNGEASHCVVTDTELQLVPARGWRETRLTLSGLPEQPFNRLRGIVSAEDPLSRGTKLTLRMEDEGGACLGEQKLTLSHSSMRYVDMSFEPLDATLAMTLSIRLAETVVSAGNSGVCVRELRLEQAAEQV